MDNGPSHMLNPHSEIVDTAVLELVDILEYLIFPNCKAYLGRSPGGWVAGVLKYRTASS